MIVTAEERTAYFLGKLETRWPNRLALSVKETAQTLHEMLGVKLGTGAEELVRRAIQSGRLIPGLGRPAGRQWRIPLYDLAYHFGHGFQPGDLATTSKLATIRRRPVTPMRESRSPESTPKRRGRAAIVPSSGFLDTRETFRLHGKDGDEVWQLAPEQTPDPLPTFDTEAQQQRDALNRERAVQIWEEVSHALRAIRARERAEQSMALPAPTRARGNLVKSRT